MRRPRLTPAGVLAAAVAAPWVLWATLRALGLDRGYPLVALVAFSPYMAALAPLPVVVALLLRRRGVAVVAAAAAMALVGAVAPRMLEGPRKAQAHEGGRTLVVMTANLRYGGADASALLRLVRERGVDVLGLQELTPDAVARLDAAGAAGVLPARTLRPEERSSGLGVLARSPLRALPPAPGPQTHLEAVLSVGGGDGLRLVTVHTLPPISRPNTLAWRRALRDLPRPRAGRVPRVLLGDFNATLDHREMRRLLDRGYVDAADATGDGLRPTWPTAAKRPPLTIDHVLFAPPIRVRRVSVHALPGTDHRAVIAELVLPA